MKGKKRKKRKKNRKKRQKEKKRKEKRQADLGFEVVCFVSNKVGKLEEEAIKVK